MKKIYENDNKELFQSELIFLILPYLMKVFHEFFSYNSSNKKLPRPDIYFLRSLNSSILHNLLLF